MLTQPKQYTWPPSALLTQPRQCTSSKGNTNPTQPTHIIKGNANPTQATHMALKHNANPTQATHMPLTKPAQATSPAGPEQLPTHLRSHAIDIPSHASSSSH